MNLSKTVRMLNQINRLIALKEELVWVGLVPRHSIARFSCEQRVRESLSLKLFRKVSYKFKILIGSKETIAVKVTSKKNSGNKCHRPKQVVNSTTEISKN